MDDTLQILSGRGLWWRCHIMEKMIYCSTKHYDCDRIIGIEFPGDSFKGLFLCVCLTYDCAENFDNYKMLVVPCTLFIT